MKSKLLALALLAGGSMFAETRFSIGIHIGGNSPGYYAPAPQRYVAARPPCPGPDYFWTDGYWDQGHGRRIWVNGYWNRQPNFRSHQSAPDYGRRSYDRRQGYDRSNDRGRANGYNDGFRNR
jgi:hypothetical protein